MTDKKNNDQDKEAVKKKIEELIKKKSDENSALKKLLDGLTKSDPFTNKDI